MVTGTKGREYPFTVWTTLDLKPTTIDIATYGHFVRIPSNNKALWSFEDETGRNLFWHVYKEKVI